MVLARAVRRCAVSVWTFVAVLMCFVPAMVSFADNGNGVEVETALFHDSMEMRIGYPAIIKPGGAYPSVEIKPGHESELVLEGEIIRECDGAVDRRIDSRTLGAGESTVISFGDETPDEGRYRIQFRLKSGDREVFRDAYYFTAGLDELRAHLPEDENYSRVVFPGEDGRLVYIPDYRGNRVPDFSRVGYRSGDEEIPDVPVKVTLEPEEGDDHSRIQAAIDEVSALEPDERGIRGAVLLKEGVYILGNDLTISASGVVLRGEGAGEDKKNLWLNPDNWMNLEELKEYLAGKNVTALVRPGGRTGYGGGETLGLIRIQGRGLTTDRETATEIVDNYVPVGAHTFRVENPGDFQAGDRVVVRRRGNSSWINEIGMDRIPGERPWPQHHSNRYYKYDFERTIIAVEGNSITIDSPVFAAIEKRWGGGEIFKYDDSARVTQVGVEGMRVILQRNGRPDVYMQGRGVVFRNARDCWVSDVVLEHFSEGGVFMVRDSSHITIRDSSVLVRPREYFSSGITWGRSRSGFSVSRGSGHVLVTGGHAINSRHAYVVCAWVKGPNVFHDSSAENCITWSEPHHRWSTGGLFDNLEASRMAIMNRLRYGSGQGWAGANYVGWNTRGILVCEQPPTAQNWAIGHVGTKRDGPFHGWNMAQFGYSYGYWESHGEHVRPESLYRSQFEDRLTRTSRNLESGM